MRTIVTAGALRPTPVSVTGVAARLRIFVHELGNVLLAVPALLLLVVLLVGWPLSLVGVGLLLVVVAVPLTERLARLHRGRLGRILGEDVVVEYRAPRGPDVRSRPWTWVRDPARLRDIAYLAFASTGGFALSMAAAAILALPVAHLVLTGVLDLPWLPLALPLDVAVWWTLTPYLFLARARVEQAIFRPSRAAQLERQVAAVATSRAETVDHSATELRRIERDLHDGAQARIVSLGMHLGLAEELMRRDPDAAAALLAEAREATTSALEDLRTVVRGIHPPVLADRGLGGAVQALAMQLAVPVTVHAETAGPLPQPVETAVYFAVAECLANVVKHSGAVRAWVTLAHRDGLLRAEIGDDGRGGAVIGGTGGSGGSGLAGVARRLRAFDGTMAVDSPAGGPTLVTLEVPCAWSSPRISPS